MPELMQIGQTLVRPERDSTRMLTIVYRQAEAEVLCPARSKWLDANRCVDECRYFVPVSGCIVCRWTHSDGPIIK